MPEMQKKIGSHHARFGDKLCDRSAKLPNLVLVAVVGFIYFWRKMKAFRPLEGRAVVKFNLNGSI